MTVAILVLCCLSPSLASQTQPTAVQIAFMGVGWLVGRTRASEVEATVARPPEAYAPAGWCPAGPVEGGRASGATGLRPPSALPAP